MRNDIQDYKTLQTESFITSIKDRESQYNHANIISNCNRLCRCEMPDVDSRQLEATIVSKLRRIVPPFASSIFFIAEDMYLCLGRS
jgi:hypothetical protein